MERRLVPTRDGTIRLGQFLKLANVAPSGSDAKALLTAESVEVNGVVEHRRGRQLVRGDLVLVVGEELEVG